MFVTLVIYTMSRLFASMGLAGVLWFALAIAFGAAFLSGVAPRNPLPFLALFAASCVAPLILAGILESILQRLLLARFRRLFQRPA